MAAAKVKFRSLLCGVALVAAPVAWTLGDGVAFGSPQAGAPQGVPGGRGGPPGGAPAGSNAMGNELVDGLKATKGCLGVETAFTSSRKSVIFAWFEDKAATLRWYESDVHQTLMMGMSEGAAAAGGDGAAADEAKQHAEERVPLAGVPDGVPVLCIATITPSAKPMVPGFPMPISQVSIELYTPLPGGLALNGKFAPAALKVAGMVEHTLGSPAGATPAAPQGAPSGGGGQGAKQGN